MVKISHHTNLNTLLHTSRRVTHRYLHTSTPYTSNFNPFHDAAGLFSSAGSAIGGAAKKAASTLGRTVAGAGLGAGGAWAGEQLGETLGSIAGGGIGGLLGGPVGAGIGIPIGRVTGGISGFMLGSGTARDFAEQHLGDAGRTGAALGSIGYSIQAGARLVKKGMAKTRRGVNTVKQSLDESGGKGAYKGFKAGTLAHGERLKARLKTLRKTFTGNSLETVTGNVRGKTRREVLNGREMIVVPMTMIVPGVLNGSKGALYYPPEEIAKDPTAWNHMPIVLDHPMQNGMPVSARDPNVLNQFGMGYVFRSKAQGKLKSEGWFDVKATQRVSPQVYNSLVNGEPIELSTGLFTENYKAPPGAVFNGREYHYVARNYRPDHLAILVGKKGACSRSDGCGVLLNEQSEVDGVLLNSSDEVEDVLLNEDVANSEEMTGDAVFTRGGKKVEPFKVSRLGHHPVFDPNLNYDWKGQRESTNVEDRTPKNQHWVTVGGQHRLVDEHGNEVGAKPKSRGASDPIGDITSSFGRIGKVAKALLGSSSGTDSDMKKKFGGDGSPEPFNKKKKAHRKIRALQKKKSKRSHTTNEIIPTGDGRYRLVTRKKNRPIGTFSTLAEAAQMEYLDTLLDNQFTEDEVARMQFNEDELAVMESAQPTVVNDEGRWITTKGGKHIQIGKGGEIVKGNIGQKDGGGNVNDEEEGTVKKVAKGVAGAAVGAAGASSGGWLGAAAGAGIGSAIAPGVGTAIGAGIGGLIGSVGGAHGASKAAEHYGGKSAAAGADIGGFIGGIGKAGVGAIRGAAKMASTTGLSGFRNVVGGLNEIGLAKYHLGEVGKTAARVAAGKAQAKLGARQIGSTAKALGKAYAAPAALGQMAKKRREERATQNTEDEQEVFRLLYV